MGNYKHIYWSSKEIICHAHSAVLPPCGTESTFIHLESAFLAFVFEWE